MGERISTLVETAGRMLYKAKKEGKIRVVTYAPEVESPMADNFYARIPPLPIHPRVAARRRQSTGTTRTLTTPRCIIPSLRAAA